MEHRVIWSKLDTEEKTSPAQIGGKEGRKVMMFCWSKFTDFKTLKEKMTQ